MNIIGPDALVFGVDELEACACYLVDYGLKPVFTDERGRRFEALDGTAIVLHHQDDPVLPPSLGTASMLRKTVYGVDGPATLEAIAAELQRDREVRRLLDGSLETEDDMGFTLGFQVSVRRPLRLSGEAVNAPGVARRQAVNALGVDEAVAALPRSLSYVVYFVPDAERAETFYVERLGFTCTDRLPGAGPFLKPAGTADHHTLLLIQTPPFMKGCERFAFHMGGPIEVMQARTRLVNKGYQSFRGPGQHKTSSNWFWYFNSPLGCHVEYDADMALHDESGAARNGNEPGCLAAVRVRTARQAGAGPTAAWRR